MTAETLPAQQEIQIAPLDPQKHDRDSFSCGVARLDNFLKRSARKQQAGNFTRVWIASRLGRSEIIGYYALNAHRLEVDSVPSGLTRHAPPHGGIPAVYLSMIAVSLRHQGKGHGKFLLADALQRVARTADQIGLKAVVLDVIEDGGPELAEKRTGFYKAMGFQPLPNQPRRLVISTESIRRAMDSER